MLDSSILNMFVSQSGMQTQICDDVDSIASSGFGCDEKSIKAVCEQKVSYSPMGNLLVFIVVMLISLMLEKIFHLFQHNCLFRNSRFFGIVCHFKNREGLLV